MKGLAAGAAGFCGLWSKMGEKPHEFHEFARNWDYIELFVLYYLTNFSPDGEVKILINFAKGRSTTSN